jgi:hypothetical protein
MKRGQVSRKTLLEPNLLATSACETLASPFKAAAWTPGLPLLLTVTV